MLAGAAEGTAIPRAEKRETRQYMYAYTRRNCVGNACMHTYIILLFIASPRGGQLLEVLGVDRDSDSRLRKSAWCLMSHFLLLALRCRNSAESFSIVLAATSSRRRVSPPAAQRKSYYYHLPIIFYARYYSSSFFNSQAHGFVYFLPLKNNNEN